MINNPLSDAIEPDAIPAPEEFISAETLCALRDGEPEAYEEVYLHYITPLKNFLHLLLRSRTEAEEIAQNVFLKLWEYREKIDPGKNIKGYLYTLARNEAFNHFAHLKVIERHRRHATFSHPRDEWASDAELIREETELLIEIALSKMPPQRRRIFEMSRRQGLSNEEIAKHLDLSKSTVENNLSYALKDIRKVIAWLIFLCLHP